MKLWDKREDESPPAFAAFQTYRDLGSERSISHAAKIVEKDISLLERWSTKHKWVLRASAYDAWLDQEAQAKQLKERTEMAKRHAKMAMMVQQKLVERLNEFNADSITPGEIPRWFDVAVKVERLSRGATTETIGLENVNNEELDLSSLSDDELAELDTMLKKARSDGSPAKPA